MLSTEKATVWNKFSPQNVQFYKLKSLGTVIAVH
jgi:hypothetical protein